MKNLYNIFFFFFLIFSIFFSISSYSWFSFWLGLEINFVCFIYLIFNNLKILSIESSLIYFLVQSLVSVLLLFSFLIYLMNINLVFFYFDYMNYFILMLMIVKLGGAPLHFWFPLVMNGLNWFFNYMIMTWQKIAPLVLIYYCINNLIFFFLVFSVFLGSLLGLNQLFLKKLMSFSSINQLGWFMLSLLKSINLFKIYLFLYFLILFMFIYLLMVFNLFNFNQLYLLNCNKLIIYYFFFCLFSLGGLPPFLGFLPKMILMLLVNNLFILIFLVLFTLIVLYYYLKIVYFVYILNYLKNNFYFNKYFISIFMKLMFFFNCLIYLYFII